MGVCLVVGCASVVELEPLGSRLDAGWTRGEGPLRLLVAGHAYDAGMRLHFERGMVAALRARGIPAEASSELMPDLRLLTGPVLAGYLQASPESAVLLARALSVTKERTRTGRDASVTGLLETNSGAWDVTTGVLLEASLFVPGRADPVWAERTRLQAQEDAGPEALDAYVAALVESLARDGLVAGQR